MTENKIFTVAIIGCGARGALTYGRLINKRKDQFKIVSLCDLREDRLTRFAAEFGVEPGNTFTDENAFFKEKRADILVIGTQDGDHVRHCLSAFACGYDVMLEKPITDKREECEAILAAQKKHGNKALVCHVLRYAPAYVKAKNLIAEGKIGRLVAIDLLEPVGNWHQAHSYVRGSWRNTEVAAPMILAKCCHDLDLLQWYAASRCVSLSSVGDLTFFKPACAPEGATAMCLDCPHKDSCPYSAKAIYLDMWKKNGAREDDWPTNVFVNAPLSEEKITDALKTSPYGRCVFHCDNNVVDHQMVQMTFENGVKASLTMTGFTIMGGRRATFYGTYGELTLDDDNVILKRFGEEPVVYPVSILLSGGYATHGGGDEGMIATLYDMMAGKGDLSTSLEASVESHLMGIAAEESRLAGGVLVKVH